MLNQNYNEKVVMHSSCLKTISSPCSGVKRILLERSEDSEYAVSTTLVEFQANTFYDEHGSYPKYTWIRSPHMSQHTPYTLNDGAVIFVKTGHLLKKINE